MDSEDLSFGTSAFIHIVRHAWLIWIKVQGREGCLNESMFWLSDAALGLLEIHAPALCCPDCAFNLSKWDHGRPIFVGKQWQQMEMNGPHLGTVTPGGWVTLSLQGLEKWSKIKVQQGVMVGPSLCWCFLLIGRHLKRKISQCPEIAEGPL